MSILVIRKKAELNKLRSSLTSSNQKLGFLPTMGALHDGHMSLVRRARAESDYVIASIFVNPTQFDNQEDLTKYPRTLAEDLALLDDNYCDALYFPSIEEIYPDGQDTAAHSFEFGELVNVMEGEHREGHFDGVAIVVSRLLNAIQPDRLFMGMKDFQQLAVVKSMLMQMGSAVELIACETVREQSGLAKSSRNVRLGKIEKEEAVQISKALNNAKVAFDSQSIKELKEDFKNHIGRYKNLKLEYVEISDATTLVPVSIKGDNNLVLCCAVWAGDVRLIDNVLFE